MCCVIFLPPVFRSVRQTFFPRRRARARVRVSFLAHVVQSFCRPAGQESDDRGCSGPITLLASFKDTVWRLPPWSTGFVNKNTRFLLSGRQKKKNNLSLYIYYYILLWVVLHFDWFFVLAGALWTRRVRPAFFYVFFVCVGIISFSQRLRLAHERPYR